MKRPKGCIWLLGLAIGLIWVARQELAAQPPATPTLPPATPTHTAVALEARQLAVTLSLTCRELAEDGLLWQNWRPNLAQPYGATHAHALATDGDLLWAATGSGLLRLDRRTGDCVLLTRGAGLDLAAVYPLLPDGAGGLWTSAGQQLLHFSSGQWRVAHQIPAQGSYPSRINALGLRQNGDLCLMTIGGRFGSPKSLCFAGSSLPLGNAYDDTDLMDVSHCALWQRMAFGSSVYASPAACEQWVTLTQGYPFAIATADKDESWLADGSREGPWRLIQRRGEQVKEIETPYTRIRAIAIDPVHGGLWLASEDELLYGEFRPPPESDDAQPNQLVFQPVLLNVESSPGDVHALAVDEGGQVWAVSGRNLWRYDETDHAWLKIAPPAHRPDAIAADPQGGIWVAGGGRLSHLDGAEWQTWPLPGDVSLFPTALLVSRDGRLWLGTLAHGLWTTPLPSRPADGAPDWQAFGAPDGLADARITALAQSPDGRVYAAHHAGIAVLEPAAGVAGSRWRTLPGSDVGDGRWVNALTFGSPQASGDLWVGLYPGAQVRHYRSGHWTDYALDEERDDEAVNGVGALLLNERGDLWVGTNRGLWRWLAAGHGEPRWQTFQNGPVVQHVLALQQDSKGRLWVAGQEGIAMWQEERGGSWQTKTVETCWPWRAGWALCWR